MPRCSLRGRSGARRPRHARAEVGAARGSGRLRSSHPLRCAPRPCCCQAGTGKQAPQPNRKAALEGGQSVRSGLHAATFLTGRICDFSNEDRHTMLQPDRNVRWRAKLKCPVGPNGELPPEAVQVFLGRSRRRPVPRPVAWPPRHGDGRPGQAPQPRRGRGVSREGLRRPGGGGQAPLHGEAPDGGCRDGCAALSGPARRLGRAW